MRILRVLMARLRALVRRDVIADEIRDEMAFHMDMRADQYARDGLPDDEARRIARRRFGNLALMQDRGYDVRGGGFLETVVQDGRYALRLLRTDRAFSAVAILTLALGIGLSTALFSVIEAAIIRPLPYPHPEELVDLVVAVANARNPDGVSRVAPSMDDIRIWRSAGILSEVGMGRTGGFTPLIVDAGEPERLVVGSATDGFLDAYGVQPVIGRRIRREDTEPSSPAVVLLGHAYWRRQFAGDAAALGRVLRIDNEPAVIVGVLPSGFFDKTAVWQVTKAADLRRGSGTPVVGRLRAGVSIEEVSRVLVGALTTEPVASGQPPVVRVEVRRLYDETTSGYRDTIWTLAYAVGLIVIIACINVAGLLLARGSLRRPELAIRSAIGAGRGRLVRQMLTESVVLALSGGTLGVLLGWLALDSLVAVIPLSLPDNAPATIDATVLAFALALSAATALLFGTLPSVVLSRADARLTRALAAAGQRAGGLLTRRGGQTLIAIEIAIAVVLLTSSGLVLRSFARLMAVDLGFDPEAVMTVKVEPIDQTPDARQRYYTALQSALGALPDVAAVGAIDTLSLGGGGMYGFPEADTGITIQGPQRTILPGYFEALGVRSLQGRLPAAADLSRAESVLVLNEVAAKLFTDGSAVGHVLRLPLMRGRTGPPPPMPIVGVVPALRHSGPQGRARPEAYIVPGTAAQSGMGGFARSMAMVIRARDGARVPVERVREVAESLDTRVLVGAIEPASAILGEQVARPRHRMQLLAVLGVCGLALTVVGVFSVTAYAVARRTQEIGVRMAFGARPGDVVARIVRDTLWPVLGGLALGLLGAFYATQLVTRFLFETRPRDAATFASAAALMLAAALVAAWIPARRAARVDPIVALRAE